MRFLWKTSLLCLALSAGLLVTPATSARAAEPLPSRVWDDLASSDPATAERAAKTLDAAGAAETLAYLRARVRPVVADEKRLAALIEDLDSRSFARRCRATEELEYLGKLAEPALVKALAEHPPLEVRRRLEVLISRFQPVVVMLPNEELLYQTLIVTPNPVPKPAVIRIEDRDGLILRPAVERPVDKLPQIATTKPLIRNPAIMERDMLRLARNHVEFQQVEMVPRLPLWVRAQRAIAMLEKIGTPEARKALESLANGAPEAMPTQQAKAALDRLNARAAQ
jgi:hypothetical protein